MASHVQVLGVLFVVFGALFLLSAFALSVIFGILASVANASGDPDRRLSIALFGLTGAALTVTLVAFSIPSIACGWGLLKHRRWGRVLGIVLAAVALIQVPYGTVFGVYALWVLFNKKTEVLFDGDVTNGVEARRASAGE